MSVEEDTELRDLVTQTLEANGCLSKIRAQLRASIILALHEDEELQNKSPLQNDKIKTQLESVEGRLMFCLVREFLEYFNLDFTISVYEAESYLGSAYNYEGRCKIMKDLGLKELEKNSHTPLLLQLIELTLLNNKNKIIDNDVVNSYGDSFQSITDETNQSLIKPTSRALNETFDISNGEASKKEDSIKKQSKSSNEKEDTSYANNLTQDASKDSSTSYLIELDKSDTDHSQIDDKSKHLLNQTYTEQDRTSPIAKDVKLTSKFEATLDKIKLSPQKTEKLKAKSNLTSLSDLPPLQLNKTRESPMVLPSLYNKDYREKKLDLDPFLDIDAMDNYEEDFMSSGELELGLTKINVRQKKLNDHEGNSQHLQPNGVNDSREKKEVTDNKTDSSVSEESNVDEAVLTASASQ